MPQTAPDLARVESVANYRPDIDGLRAIAIVPVILYHVHLVAFSGGYLGVDVFFVVSGFLITSLIAPEIAQGRFSYLSFWERRARRLLPAMFTAIAATALVAYWLLMPDELQAFGRSVVSVVLFSSNFYFWSKAGYFDTSAQTSPLLHTWSLAVEEQFYLLFPAVLIAVSWSKRFRPVATVITIGAVSFLISACSVRAYPSAAYYLLPSRAWELMLGAALALLRPTRAVTAPAALVSDGILLLGLCLIAAPVFLYNSGTPFPGFAALVPCVGAALVIWFGDQRGRVHRLLDNRPTVFIGQLSYSLYLWHWPILVFAGMLSPHSLTEHFSPHQTLAIIVATIVCSWLSYVLIENPIRRRTLLTSRRPLLAAVTVGAACLAIFGLTADLGRGLQYRVPGAALQIAKGADDRSSDWDRCSRIFDRDITAQDLCRLGPHNGATPRFLLWGDSHALSFFSAVDAAARKVDIGGLHASLFQCPPVPGIDVNTSWGVDCSAFNRRISDLVDSVPFDAVILAAHWSNYLQPNSILLPNGFAGGNQNEFFIAQLRAAIDRLSSKGVAVFVVAEVPFTKNFRPNQYARAAWWGLTVDAAALSVASYEARTQPFWDSLAGSPFERISLVRYLCPDGTFCPAIMDGWSNYFDDNHLTTHGANRVTPAFVDALQGIRAKFTGNRLTPFPSRRNVAPLRNSSTHS
jgi:peptidoglycan/LPS O-acetylase OafA/YrhL